MVEQLQVFGSEVSRVAREVGTEGNLGGQAQISGVSGIWKELTENGLSPPFLLTGYEVRLGIIGRGRQTFALYDKDSSVSL